MTLRLKYSSIVSDTSQTLSMTGVLLYLFHKFSLLIRGLPVTYKSLVACMSTSDQYLFTAWVSISDPGHVGRLRYTEFDHLTIGLIPAPAQDKPLQFSAQLPGSVRPTPCIVSSWSGHHGYASSAETDTPLLPDPLEVAILHG